MEQKVLLDLFCGVGGWSKPFLAAGWRCIGFDVASLGYPGEFVQGTLPVALEVLRSYRPDLVLASPPCEDFARYHLPWIHCDIPPDETLLRWSVGLVGQVGCPVVVECSRFAAMHVPGSLVYGSYALWGDVPALMPDLPRWKMRRSGMRPDLRAEIPGVLATWLLWCYGRESVSKALGW